MVITIKKSEKNERQMSDFFKIVIFTSNEKDHG